jgi:hypothetical protein
LVDGWVDDWVDAEVVRCSDASPDVGFEAGAGAGAGTGTDDADRGVTDVPDCWEELGLGDDG